jgi:hypothetical protein
MIKFVSDVWQIGGFLPVLRFSPPIKLTATIELTLLLKVTLITITLTQIHKGIIFYFSVDSRVMTVGYQSVIGRELTMVKYRCV